MIAAMEHANPPKGRLGQIVLGTAAQSPHIHGKDSTLAVALLAGLKHAAEWNGVKKGHYPDAQINTGV